MTTTAKKLIFGDMGEEYPFFLTLKKSIVLKPIILNPRLVS